MKWVYLIVGLIMFFEVMNLIENYRETVDIHIIHSGAQP